MLKKLVLKAAMFGFVMFGLSAYAGYLITGHLPPYLDGFRNFLPTSRSASAQPNWSDIGALEHKTTAQKENYEVMQSGKTVIYKWRNPNGTWNYSSVAPPAGVHAARQEITTPVTNVPVSAVTGPDRTQSQATGAENGELVNPYSPEGVKELIDRAKQVRQKVEERNQEQQSRLDKI